METRKIKCPHCSAVLTVKYFQGIEGKNIPCPVCHVVSSYAAYKSIEEKGTLYYKDIHQYHNTQNMSAVLRLNGVPKFVLKKGKNVIGRKSPKSTADFQIEDEERYLSREHLAIDGVEVGGKGMEYRVYLFKERINPTYINDQLLEFGDCIILKDKDVLKLPGVTLTFGLVDTDGTIF